MINHSQKIREPLELWLIVEANFDYFFSSGLCGVIRSVVLTDRMTKDEGNYLVSVLNDYRNEKNNFDLYIWRESFAYPRKMFIQKQIIKELRK